MMNQMRIGVSIALLGLMAGAAGDARADVVLYNDFGPGNTYSSGYFGMSGPLSAPGTSDTANGFIVPGAVGTSYTLTSITLAVALISGENVLNVALMSDYNGLPGAVIESFQFTNAMSLVTPNPTFPPLEVDSTLHPVLQAGNRYWLAAFGTGDQQAVWYANDIGALRIGAYTVSSGIWQSAPSPQPAAAFCIEGDAITTPEPSTLVSACIAGLMGLGYAWLRRKV